MTVCAFCFIDLSLIRVRLLFSAGSVCAGFSSTARPAAKQAALHRAFLSCDAQCILEQQRNGQKSGTTACVVVVDHDAIYASNCGDTRAILCRAGQAIELTRDHKPGDPEEKNRMEAAGARVPPGSGYVELGDTGLAVARAFGNPLFKNNPTKSQEKQAIVPTPFISRTPRNHAQDEFLILATDGLWNVVSHQYAAEFVRKRLLASSSFADVEDIAHKLTQHALDRKSQDNVTLVIVLFPVAFRGELLAQVATIQVQPAAAASGAAASAAAGSGSK